MKKMPKSAIRWYKMWISHFPETWHPSDMERFYMFISILLNNAKKERNRFWLKENLKEDCPKLSDSDMEKYCDIYEHIRDFKKVWSGHQAKLIAKDDFLNRKKELLL